MRTFHLLALSLATSLGHSYGELSIDELRARIDVPSELVFAPRTPDFQRRAHSGFWRHVEGRPRIREIDDAGSRYLAVVVGALDELRRLVEKAPAGGFDLERHDLVAPLTRLLDAQLFELRLGAAEVLIAAGVTEECIYDRLNDLRQDELINLTPDTPRRRRFKTGPLARIDALTEITGWRFPDPRDLKILEISRGAPMRSGEPSLPRHARLRLGSTRFAAGATPRYLFFSGDGSKLVTQTSDRLTVFSVPAGLELASHKVFTEPQFTLSEERDGVVGPGDFGDQEIRDLVSWELIDKHEIKSFPVAEDEDDDFEGGRRRNLLTGACESARIEGLGAR